MILALLTLSPWWLWGALGVVVMLAGGLLYVRAGRLSGKAVAGLAGAAGVILLLLLFRSALGTAKAAGIAEERATWQALAAEYKALKAEAASTAEDTRQESLVRIDTATAAHMEKSRTYYDARPSERDAVVFDGDRVREIRAARAAIAATAIGGAGGPPHPSAGPAGSAEGRLDESPGR